MPTYEYACAKCGERFDVYQSFSDEPLKKHKECGGKLTKVFGQVGIVLKGSGFYKTDNRSSSTVKAAKQDSESGSSESGSSDSSSSDSSSGSSESGSGTSSPDSATTPDSSSTSSSRKADSAKKADAKASSTESKSA
ncbi:MAG: FmdB family zinc ribbon protein [Acidimicrobiia bacterium]